MGVPAGARNRRTHQRKTQKGPHGGGADRGEEGQRNIEVGGGGSGGSLRHATHRNY